VRNLTAPAKKSFYAEDMAYYPSKGNSLWLDTATAPSYPALEGDVTVDVAVIGGGIAGLSAACFLKQRGYTVAVLEKHTIGSGVSGYTTAKVTSQHGLIYARLLKHYGVEQATIYGRANQAALATIEDIIMREQIACDWQRQDNYVFTEDEQQIATLQEEARVAVQIGLPASYEETMPLPIPIKGAVRFKNQATFHIMKYLAGLAAAVDGQGSRVFEYTKAGHVADGDPCTIATKKGKVTAKKVIMATNAPYAFKDHVAYAAYEYPTRSYLIATQAPGEFRGMAISVDKPSRSILPTFINGEQWLLIGGDGHFVGLSGPASIHYTHLEEYANDMFQADKAAYQWSTWDFVPYDDRPLVGPLYPSSKNVFTATGFQKWGMTNATVAGLILTDAIDGQPNEWAEVFLSNRLSAVKALPRGIARGISS